MRAALLVALALALASPSLAAPSNTTGSALGPKPAPLIPNGLGPAPKPTTPTDPIAARYSAVYDGCMRKAVSTLDMLECAGKETDRWDARLNRAYQSRMASLNDRQRRALKQAEKAWILFREADCAAYQDEEWGTISRIDASQCFLRRTVERALELEAFPADHGPG
jgi:uncharacterized protein YecT (DUF1311 family)